MDISEIYIKMCDCEEIQEPWDVKPGDYIANYWINFKQLDKDTYKRKRGKFIKVVIINEEVTPRIEKLGAIFLPRQDQIQEMCPWHEPERVVQWMIKFYYWLVNTNVAIFTTLEQLWLAFYMFEKHRLFWSGDKWIKERGGQE